eukprot:GFUD01006349.1.p1 GENE.GFUD01006349.1~~GFUD01006349.1.p1  ORF type:complete len:199 (-),score=69.53 GFUD01006349.1:360-935(-)
MVLPYLGAALTLVLLAISLNQSQGVTVISEEDLIRALMAREAAQQPGYVGDPGDADLRLMGKRARQAGFSSWAGKRGGRNQHAFSSWAGKRSGREQQAFSSWAGKRAPFNSWAGKRSGEDEVFHEPEYVRRKRSSEESELFEDSSELLPGGGRFARDLRGTQAQVKAHQDEMVFRPARATFSAWGGKRAER